MKRLMMLAALAAFASGCASYVDNYNHTIAKEKKEKPAAKSEASKTTHEGKH